MSVRRAALVISPPTTRHMPKLRLLRDAGRAPVATTDAQKPAEAIQANSANEARGQHPLKLTTTAGRSLKRSLDLCLSVPAVLFAIPVLCFVVKISQLFQSSGPLFYCQKRCGRDGREFTIFKFRTMDLPPAGRTDIEENPGARIYPLGKILRRSKLDEVPQFINVLLGSMSVVGPRPHHFDDCQKFSLVVGDYSLRTVTKPGITGLAQYTAYRGDFEWNCVENRVAKDLTYIHNWSIVLDVLLILKTATIVCRAVVGGVLRRMSGLFSRNTSPPAKSSPATLTVYAPDTDDEASDATSPEMSGTATNRRAA